MKNKWFLLLMGIFSTAVLLAQNNCEAFFPFKAGVTMEYTLYGKKDKVETVAVHRVKELGATADGGVKAEVETSVSDDKGKKIIDGVYSARCKDNVLYMDLTRLLPPQLMQTMGQMEATMEGEGLAFPSNLQVGQSLPDASTTIKMNGSGLGNLMNMTISVTDRKVESKESVTTPAGTFDCYKITSTTYVKSIIGQTTRSAEWFAKDVGVVKSEFYDKKGNMDGYMLLTKLE